MIRAIVQNGMLQPLDPIPGSWGDGRELSVAVAEVVSETDLDSWRLELEELVLANDSADFAQVQSLLSETDRLEKESMQRHMELQP